MIQARWGFAMAVAMLLSGTASAQAGGPMATLVVQVLATDDGLAVAESLRGTGASTAVSWTVPLLVPEDAAGPALVPRNDANPQGIDVKATGGAQAAFSARGILVSAPAGTQEFQVQLRYNLPVRAGRLVLSATPEMALSRVQVVTRRSKGYAAQVRPLAPYGFREEVEEDGTWQYLTLLDPVPAGTPLRIALAHLPAPFGPYRAAGVAVVGVALLSLGVVVGRKRKA